MYVKEIVYDRSTRDYAMYLDNELVGFGRTYHEAEIELDRLVFDALIYSTVYEPTPPPPPPEPDDNPDKDSKPGDEGPSPL